MYINHEWVNWNTASILYGWIHWDRSLSCAHQHRRCFWRAVIFIWANILLQVCIPLVEREDHWFKTKEIGWIASFIYRGPSRARIRGFPMPGDGWNDNTGLHPIKTSKSIDKSLFVSRLDAKHVVWKCFLCGTCGIAQWLLMLENFATRCCNWESLSRLLKEHV